jgi:hypothetical protein
MGMTMRDAIIIVIVRQGNMPVTPTPPGKELVVNMKPENGPGWQESGI